MRQRLFPATAGARHGVPRRVLAPQRGLASIGPVLRSCEVLLSGCFFIVLVFAGIQTRPGAFGLADIADDGLSTRMDVHLSDVDALMAASKAIKHRDEFGYRLCCLYAELEVPLLTERQTIGGRRPARLCMPAVVSAITRR